MKRKEKEMHKRGYRPLSAGFAVHIKWIIWGLLAIVFGTLVIVLVSVYGNRIDAHIAAELPCTPCPTCPTNNDSSSDIDTIFRANGTIFVSKVWPVTWAGHTVPNYFTTVKEALDEAFAMGVSNSNRVEIIVFPGTYTEDLTMLSYVSLRGSNDAAVIVGAMKWTPGVGVNANFSAGIQTLSLSGLSLGSFSMDMTGAAGSVHGQVTATDCTFSSNVGPLIMGNTGSNFMIFRDCTVEGTVNASVSSLVYMYTSTMVGNVAASAGALLAYGTTFEGNLNIALSDIVTLTGCLVAGTTSLTNGGLLSARGCDFQGAVDTDGTSASDIRMCEWTSITGAGTVDRSVTKLTATPSGNGANTLTISPPLPDASYGAIFTQTAPTTNRQIPVVTSQTGSSLVYNVADITGGVTFHVILVEA